MVVPQQSSVSFMPFLRRTQTVLYFPKFSNIIKMGFENLLLLLLFIFSSNPQYHAHTTTQAECLSARALYDHTMPCVVIGKRFAGALDADRDELFSRRPLLENSLGGGDGRASAVATGNHHAHIPSAPRSSRRL